MDSFCITVKEYTLARIERIERTVFWVQYHEMSLFWINLVWITYMVTWTYDMVTLSCRSYLLLIEFDGAVTRQLTVCMAVLCSCG